MVVKQKLIIRRALPGEFVFMAHLAARAWQNAVGAHALTDKRQNALADRFLRELSENPDGVLLIEREHELTGWGARIPATNYISDLWIDPNYHRQGQGCVLLDALLANIIYDGFDCAEIGTHADNLPAIALYEKTGFQVYWRGFEWSESCACEVEKIRMRLEL